MEQSTCLVTGSTGSLASVAELMRLLNVLLKSGTCQSPLQSCSTLPYLSLYLFLFYLFTFLFLFINLNYRHDICEIALYNLLIYHKDQGNNDFFQFSVIKNFINDNWDNLYFGRPSMLPPLHSCLSLVFLPFSSSPSRILLSLSHPLDTI